MVLLAQMTAVWAKTKEKSKKKYNIAEEPTDPASLESSNLKVESLMTIIRQIESTARGNYKNLNYNALQHSIKVYGEHINTLSTAIKDIDAATQQVTNIIKIKTKMIDKKAGEELKKNFENSKKIHETALQKIKEEKKKMEQATKKERKKQKEAKIKIKQEERTV